MPLLTASNFAVRLGAADMICNHLLLDVCKDRPAFFRKWSQLKLPVQGVKPTIWFMSAQDSGGTTSSKGQFE
jgi:hypothetical protein